MNLALMGFRNISVIDMDTIDLSNLNRQFLFRQNDVGRFKAEVAAEFINKRVPGCRVSPHNCKIQDFDEGFYRGFHLVVCGLDSIVARRWINGMLISMLEFDDDGELDRSTSVPLVDGGTEGFKGNARVIFPGVSACIDCTLDLYPPNSTSRSAPSPTPPVCPSTVWSTARSCSGLKKNHSERRPISTVTTPSTSPGYSRRPARELTSSVSRESPSGSPRASSRESSRPWPPPTR